MTGLSQLEMSLVDLIGWMLLHSLWQLTLVAGVFAMLQVALRHRSATTRYWAGCVALLSMVGISMTTLITMTAQERGPASMEAARSEGWQRDADVDAVSSDSAALAAPLPTGIGNEQDAELQTVPTGAVANSGRTIPVDSKNNPVQSLLPVVVTAWLVGVVLLAMRPLAGLYTVHRLRRIGRRGSETLTRALDRVVSRRPLGRFVEISESVLVRVPIVVGYLRPVILMPASAATGLGAGELEAIIAHELAHVRRHDYLINFLQTLVESLFFYHPVVWWVSHRVRVEREHCCDDDAIAHCSDRAVYARALVRLEESRCRAPATVLASTGGSLVDRVRRIAGQDQSALRRSDTWLAGFLLVVMMAGGAAGLSSAADEDDTTASNAETVATAAGNQADDDTNESGSGATAPPIEIIGVSENILNPGPDRQWWGPDGTPLDSSPYSELGVYSNEQGKFEIAFRFAGVPDDVVVKTRPSHGPGRPTDARQPNEPRESTDNVRGFVVSRIPDDNRSVDISIGYANGPWEEIETWDFDGRGRGPASYISKTSVVMRSPRDTNNERVGMAVEISDTYTNIATRLLAFDVDGRRHVGVASGRGRGEGIQNRQFGFPDLRAEQLQSLRLERCEYRWFDFHKVSLRRGMDAGFTGPSTKTAGQGDGGWGSFSGRLTLLGKLPERQPLVRVGEPVKDSSAVVEDIPDESWIVAPDSKGLQNVFVYLPKAPARVHPDLIRTPSEPLKLTSRGLRYDPHALFARTGQPISLLNADPVAENVHMFPVFQSGINTLLAPRDLTGKTSVTFNKSERVPFKVSSDCHAWMRSSLLVLDHPYAAITDAEGRFRIDNLPAGQHRFRVWHESAGLISKAMTVVVRDGEDTKVDINVTKE